MKNTLNITTWLAICVCDSPFDQVIISIIKNYEYMFIHDSHQNIIWINYVKVELRTSSVVVFDWGWLRTVITAKNDEEKCWNKGRIEITCSPLNIKDLGFS